MILIVRNTTRGGGQGGRVHKKLDYRNEDYKLKLFIPELHGLVYNRII